MSFVESAITETGNRLESPFSNVRGSPGRATALALLLRFPYLDGAPTPANHRSGNGRRRQKRRRGMTILLVDDELDFRLLIRTVLTGRGHDVILAENGQEALEKLRGVSVDFVITDIYMPVMDGIKLSRSLRKMPGLATVPILYLSGYDDQYTIDAVKDPRFEGFLRKGTRVEDLLLWIEYLSSPAESRSKSLPGGSTTRTTLRPRDGTKTYTNYPIL